MKVGAIIQARLGSTRLPRKVLLALSGKTVLERVVERVKAAGLVEEVIVAATINKEDNEIEILCAKTGVKCFRGSENDVLDRYYQAAKHYVMDNIVRITADCPLMDPVMIDGVIKVHLEDKSDYTSNTLEETYPDGEDVEVFTFSALQKAWQKALLLSEREHVTPYLKKKENSFKISSVTCRQNLSSKRWTIDNPEDYLFLKEIYAGLSRQRKIFGMNEILRYLAKHPALEEINQHIGRNEGYRKSLQNDKRVK